MEMLPAISNETLLKIQRFQIAARAMPQIRIVTNHTIHVGIYTRSIAVPVDCPNDTTIVGALTKIATNLIIIGDSSVYIGDEFVRIRGYAELPAKAYRKQVFVCHRPTIISMYFRTDHTSIRECEKQFTDEYELLPPLSDTSLHRITITGE